MILVLELCTLAALTLAGARLARGPSQSDRIVALDLLFACGVALCILAALRTRRVEFLDVALGLSLTAFVTTLCWSRLTGRTRTGAGREEGGP